MPIPLIFPVRASLYKPLGSRASHNSSGKSINTYKACVLLDGVSINEASRNHKIGIPQ
jgi:hypothetical protein